MKNLKEIFENLDKDLFFKKLNKKQELHLYNVLSSSDAVSAEVIEDMAKNKRFNIRILAAASPLLSYETLKNFIENDIPSVAYASLRNKNLTKELIDIFLNRNLQEYMVHHFIKDLKNSDLLDFLFSHPKIKVLLQDKSKDIVYAFVNNKKTNNFILKYFYKDAKYNEDKYLLKSICRNPNWRLSEFE